MPTVDVAEKLKDFLWEYRDKFNEVTDYWIKKTETKSEGLGGPYGEYYDVIYYVFVGKGNYLSIYNDILEAELNKYYNNKSGLRPMIEIEY